LTNLDTHKNGKALQANDFLHQFCAQVLIMVQATLTCWAFMKNI